MFLSEQTAENILEVVGFVWFVVGAKGSNGWCWSLEAIEQSMKCLQGRFLTLGGLRKEDF